ncbi:hypothetical protein [Streptomyces pinistramenti]|uniref:hypothetical protein n=1 Tax=Streptomyces pinistramenti TaxID=2884812 RepID=UPI001D07E469|nr:hypothetical protein [Streptomyces pinistramenti]MCB5909588.1 hypothetical protein [Streptomyces pinistramenti]
MKQGTIRTLGAAALGVAFAAAAAGTAAAAPAVDAGGATGVLRNLPVEQTAKTVTDTTQGRPTPDGVNANSKGNKLLGGLPTSLVAKALPLG